MLDESEVMHRVSNMMPMWSSLVRYYKRTGQANIVGTVAHRLKLSYKSEYPDADWLNCSLRLCGSFGTELTD